MSWFRRSMVPSLVAGLLAVGAAVPAANAAPSTTIALVLDQRQAMVNGEGVTLDTAPVVDPASSRTFVPVRFIGETLGAYVGWDGTAQKVTYLAGEARIQLWIGRKTADVNGQAVALDAAPYIDANGRTQVPARFVSEQLGASVGWDAATKTVTITAPWVGRVVTIEHLQFNSASLTVPAGTRITWVNLDDVTHNVFGPAFDSPIMAPGDSFTYTFSQAGTFEYVCSFHAGMSATITVQ